MNFTSLTLGPLATNCYILKAPPQAAVIDPAADSGRILEEIKKNKLQLKNMIFTHCHGDHTAAAGNIKKHTGVPIISGKGEVELISQSSFFQFPGISSEIIEPDRYVDDGDELMLASESLKILSTPGHSPGGISIYVPGALFCGDTIFMNSAGRTDLPGGNREILEKSVKEKIFALPDETKIYPGHGPATSVKWEKKNNPFFSFH